jgi:hypothetical protein
MRTRALEIIYLCGMLAILESGCGSVASAPPPLSVSTASLPDGFVAFPYSQTLQAAGGVPPYKWIIASGNLPGGLALGNDSSAFAKIAGTPDTAETAIAFSVQVVDAKNQMATQSYTINVHSTEIAQLQQVQGSVPAGTATMIFARLEARAYFPCILPIVCRFVICKSSHILNSLHSQRLVKCVFQPQCSCGSPLSRELTREKHERLFISVEPSLAADS